MNSKKNYLTKIFPLPLVLFIVLFLLFLNPILYAQGTITPTDCKTGCTSNDVQVTEAYLSDANGTRLPSTFICPVGGTATVSITLVLSTNTQRKGVAIYSKVNEFMNPVIGDVVGEISGCNPMTLTGSQNKITFVDAFAWECGQAIVLTDLFIAWGTGNTNFCGTDLNFKCPGTPSKCNSLDAGQYLTVQTPTGQSASQTKCETTAGTGTTTFNLRESDATVLGGQSTSTYQVNWYSNAAGTTTITTPTTYVSSTGYVYAKVCTINSPIVCSGTQTVTLTVVPKSVDPTSATAGTTIICNGQTTTLTLNGGGGGANEVIKWYTSSCGGTLVGTGNGITVSPTTTTTYYGRYENTGTCNANSACASVTVTVNQKPTDPTSASAEPGTICNGQSTTLTLIGGGAGTGGVIRWYTSSCGGTLVGTGNGLTVSPTTTTIYYGRYETSAPCSTNSACASVTVTVNQKPTDPTSASAEPGIICNGQSTTLTLIGGSAGTGGVVKWYTSSCGGTLVGTGNGITVSPTTTTTYYGRYETSAPCSTNSACASVTVTVNQKPTDPTSASAEPGTICNGQSTTLTLNGGSAGTGGVIKWYTSSCGGTLVGTGNGITVSPTTTTTYYGRYETGAPCNVNSACASVTVNVGQIPSAPTVCIVVPSLCDATKTQFKISFGSPVEGSLYSIDGGNTWTSTSVFCNVAAGSNPVMKVQTGVGCVSSPTTCAEASICTEDPNCPTVNGNNARYSGNTTDKVHINFPAKEPSVLAYPNPYNDKIRFVVTAPESGQGSLDLFNVLGQKVRTVYQGNIIQGTQTFEVSIPQQQRSTLIYRMILNGRQASGKLINANQ